MATLPGTVSHAPAGLGFDTATVVTAEVADALYDQGYRFCARYLHRSKQVDEAPCGGALSIAEAQTLLAAGLGLIPVQYGDAKLVPSASLGTSVGEAAASNAAGLGFPAGVTVWCDVEFDSAHKPSSSADTIAYINAWAEAVATAGFRPGLYVGPNMPLSSSELYYKLGRVTSYWKAASLTPWVDERGFQMIQGLSLTTAGLYIDPDIACYDNKHDRFYLLASAAKS
ncbi:MAG TPA: glycoside hydrolase domain-containing protein [Enhygromyxa sp.]|nr:glycoside hydrolase domain-containing protein [Enhygromyxa sp.]